MADVKVPPMLHKMSVAAQKAWYKKNKMEYPGAGGAEGRSAAQAKKDVGEINKKKAREAAIAQAAASKKNKELVSSSQRVREMGRRRRESGEGLGGGLETNRDILSYVRAGGTIKAGRLGEESMQNDKMKEKEPPFTPDKNPVRRGRGGPMSQAKWLAKQAMMKKVKEMGMREEVEQTDEALRVKDISVSNTLGTLKKAKPNDNFIAKDRAEISRKIAAHDVKSVRKKTVGNPAMRSAALKRAGYEVRKEEIESIEEGLFDKKTPEEKASKFRRAVERSVYTKSMKDNLTKDIGKGPGLKSRLGGVKSAASKYLSTTDIGKKIDKYRTNRNIAAYNRSKVAKEEVELIEQDDTMEKKEMAQTQLHFMQYAAKEILEFIAMGGQIEEWYQNKLSKVHSDMEGLHSYIEGEKRRTGMVREEVDQIDEKLDPVGKEDSDIDNDGDSDKTDVYLATKRKAIGKAIKDRLAKKLGK